MLYNKYCPRRFAQVVGQPEAIALLRQQVRRKRLAHAYLFAGPSGTGKTSTARLLAAVLNCDQPRAQEPCGQCPSCHAILQEGSHWDVMEVDAASQRGIDEARVLVRRAYLGPLSKHKVYIIDEAHGLTTPAWDALLKTLEEPPYYLVWILCTTRAQEIPDTVASRCQVVAFRPVLGQQATAYLARVARGERAQPDDSALRFLAEAAGGNLRYASTLLDQVLSANGRHVTRAQARKQVSAQLLLEQ